jgi:Zinc finger, C3HC4 type (RING finger)
MDNYLNRLESFACASGVALEESVTSLARNGFAYDRHGKRVFCVACNESFTHVGSCRYFPHNRAVNKSLKTEFKHSRVKNIHDSTSLYELTRLKQCKVCLDKDIAVTFLPCGHFIVCKDCSYISKCAVCREPIKTRITVNL